MRDAEDTDAPAITAIRNELIAVDTSEWRDEPYTVEDHRAWLADQQAGGFPVLIALDGDKVVGVATYGEFRGSGGRWPGYRYTVEHSIHVRADCRRRGHGRVLLQALVDRASGANLHVMVAGIDASNQGSIDFHEALGFDEVGRMPEIGWKFGRWLDLIFMQRLLT